ncbi:MAG: DoxX family protein [Proteobacteria bacterium]|nr:DoxX family protein [Pseudomonadota bacterium]
MQFSVVQLLQVVVALGLLNVWLVRRNMRTAYRGGAASTMVEEFAVYGFSPFFCYAIGTLKVTGAVTLLLGLMFQPLVFPASLLIAALMFGAITMHAKVGDPIKKALPASAMFIMSTIIAITASGCCL